MDWQSTQAAAIYKSGKVYTEGKGSGLLFQDYTGAPSSYGYVVTAPYADEVETDVDAQLNVKPLTKFGGYDPRLGGTTPWAIETDIDYPIGRSKITPHAYTDSSSSATSLTAGVKAVNGAVNLDGDMKEVETIARWAQRTKGFAVGAVTSVPICHATPAAAYAANVSRDDYQDLSRDLLGLPSVSRKETPHPGLDVVIGCGYGEIAANGAGQGTNFVPGNRYLAESDRDRVDVTKGGTYVVAERTPGAMARKSCLRERRRRAKGNIVSSASLVQRTGTSHSEPRMAITSLLSTQSKQESSTLKRISTRIHRWPK